MTLSWGIQDPIWRRPHVFTARPITDPIFIIIIIIFTVSHHIFEYSSDINACPLSSWQIFLIKEDLRRLFDFERSQEGVDSQVLQWVLQKSSIPIERGKACVLHSAYLPAPKYQLLFLERGCNANIPANLFLLRKDGNWHYQTSEESLTLSSTAHSRLPRTTEVIEWEHSTSRCELQTVYFLVHNVSRIVLGVSWRAW